MLPPRCVRIYSSSLLFPPEITVSHSARELKDNIITEAEGSIKVRFIPKGRLLGGQVFRQQYNYPLNWLNVQEHKSEVAHKGYMGKGNVWWLTEYGRDGGSLEGKQAPNRRRREKTRQVEQMRVTQEDRKMRMGLGPHKSLLTTETSKLSWHLPFLMCLTWSDLLLLLLLLSAQFTFTFCF